MNRRELELKVLWLEHELSEMKVQRDEAAAIKRGEAKVQIILGAWAPIPGTDYQILANPADPPGLLWVRKRQPYVDPADY